MLDLKINIAIDTEKMNNHITQKTFNQEQNSFLKVFEDVNKSFEATKEAISEEKQDNNKSAQKVKEQPEENKEKEDTSKEESPETESNEKSNETITLEQILLNYKNSIGEKPFQETTQTTQNSLELRETSEKLLHQREQTLEMTAKLINELRASQSQIATQNPIKTHSYSEKDLTAKIDAQNSKNVLVNSDTILNLQNLANTKTNETNSLADILSELDIEVTSVKTNTNIQQESKGFDFNSSTFSNLNSHITKLNLNKTADFSKVINQKLTQEQQILNQIKDGGINQLGKGTSSINIVLRPESLGRININIISNNGILSAQFTAQSQQAADTLNKNIDTLRQNLIDQGLKVSDVNIKVQESAQSETFSDTRNFDEDKLGNFRENHSNKNSFNAEKGNNNSSSKQTYIDNEEENKQEENLVATNQKSKDLGIYNNMGRKI